MLVVCATPLVVVAVAAVVSATGPAQPSVSVTVPAGYRAISDAYFGYAVPTTWAENDAATTETGTYYYQGPSGWVGETLAQRSTPPPLGEAGPAALGVFGSTAPVQFQLVGGHPTTVAGTTMAWAYELRRDGVDVGPVIDAWASTSSTEIWFAVHAAPATTSAVLGSLRA